MTTGIWIAGTIAVALIIFFIGLIRHVRRRADHDREWHG